MGRQRPNKIARRRSNLLILILGLAFSVVGCLGPSENSKVASTGIDFSQASTEEAIPPGHGRSGNGNLKLMAFAYGINSVIDSAIIDIVGIDIRQVGQGYLSFDFEPLTVDLFHLDTEIDNVLERVQLPPGQYDQIRLIVAEQGTAQLVSDGSTVDLEVPSGPQTGIKIFFTKDLLVGSEEFTLALVDIDLENSFVFTPGGVNDPTLVKFLPVLHSDYAQAIYLPDPGSSTGENPIEGGGTTGGGEGSGTGDVTIDDILTGDEQDPVSDYVDPDDYNDDNFGSVIGI